MNFKCLFCSRTFSQCLAYSQHIYVSIKKVESDEEENNGETPSTDITQDINEGDNISYNEVIEYEHSQETAQDTSFSSMESIHSNLISEISLMSYEEEIFEESKEPESNEFPNDAYKDLMMLVTKHKLNNKAGNAIIQFFNKHLALLKLPLPKNIEKGRIFMNKMKFLNLSFNKVCITYYNGKEYFLYYQNLI